MAAVGASEVITQLESAAKVLMVRTSSLFSPSAGAVKHGRAVSGGFRCSETAAVVEVGHAFFGQMCPAFAGETSVRGALPRLSPSRQKRDRNPLTALFPAPS